MIGVRRRIALIGIGLLAAVGMLTFTSPTLASWSHADDAKGSVTAGVVLPATGLLCTPGVLSARFTWLNPTGGLTRSGYAWTLIGANTGSGTLGPTVTTITISSLLTVGNSTFSLRAVGPGGWTSAAVTGTIRELTGLIITCSTP